MSKIILEKFYIHGLNGELNVDLEIVDNRKILVSENGGSKTTILGIFYSFFSRSVKINQYNFDYIKIKFKNNDEEYIYHKAIMEVVFDEYFINDIKSIDEIRENEFYKNINFIMRNLKKDKNYNDLISDAEFEKIVMSLFIYFHANDDSNVRKIFQNSNNKNSIDLRKRDVQYVIHSIKKVFDESFAVFRMKNINIDFINLYDEMGEIYKHKPKDQKGINFLIEWFEKLYDVLQGLGKNKILYFTTYRVIEKNIKSFRKDDEDDYDEDLDYIYNRDLEEAKELFKNSPIIQFGMENVKEVWQGITNDIRTSTTTEFLKLSGTLLKNVVDNKNVEEKDIQQLLKNKDSILKVISRIDQKTLNNSDIKKLLLIIEKNDLNFQNENKALFYILQNMVSIYEHQKHLDQAIELYCNSINKFFKNKKIIFNDITSEISILVDKNKKIIDVEDLSSGEKQIISIFTKIYLIDTNDEDIRYWIVYDEPEISLSIEWQELLLPEILKNKKCEFLLSATHSPFIFKNELRKYTSDLALEVTGLN